MFGLISTLFKFGVATVFWGTVVYWALMGGQGNDQIALALGIIPGAITALVWRGKKPEEKAKAVKPPKPPRDWTPVVNTVKLVIIVIVCSVVLGVGVYAYVYATSVPTTKEGWQIVEETTGSRATKPTTPTEMENYFKGAVKKYFSHLSEKQIDDYTKKLTQLVLKDQTAQFQEEWSKMINVESAALVTSRQDAFTATNQPIEAIVLVQVVCALIAAFVSFTLWEQIKITPTVVIVLVIFLIYGFLSPGDTHGVASELFTKGMTLALADTGMGIAAALFSAFRIMYRKPGGGLGVLITIGLALAGVLFGFNFESFLQAQTLTKAVLESEGLISINQALFIFQLGKTAGLMGIVTMFSSLIAYARAAPALAEMEREEQRQAAARGQNP
jgi:hypothetical protein